MNCAVRLMKKELAWLGCKVLAVLMGVGLGLSVICGTR